MAAGDIVIWEWQDENGHWVPYSPELCCEFGMKRRNQVEKHRFKIQNQKKPPSMYEMDLRTGQQRNMRTGDIRDVRIRQLHSTSVLAMGIIWEWHRGGKKNGTWTSYATDLAEFLEDQYVNGKKMFDFPLRFGMQHTVNLKKMEQVNIQTQFTRKIRRQKLSSSYSSATMSKPPTFQRPAASVNAYAMSYPGSSTTPSSNTMANPAILRPAVRPRLAPQFSNGVQPSGPTTGGFHRGQISNLSSSPLTPMTSSPLPSNLYNNSSALSKAQVPGFMLQNYGASAMSANRTAADMGSPVNGYNANRVKRKYNVPPCPPNGIPCDNSDTSGTVPVSTVLKKFTKSTTVDPSSTEDCAICQMPLTDESGFSGDESSYDTCELTLCNHVFHTECLQASYEHGVKNGCIICPSCNRMHGVKTGNQPSGYMHYRLIQSSLPGYGGFDTYMASYEIRPGIQTKEHPHPGRRYHTQGFPRVAYLPDNDEGRKVLLLLIEAWKRRLIFTVGQSSTTGREDCVIWTGIHHKTEMRDMRGHGYPDEGYLNRVLLELAAEGVVEEEEEEEEEEEVSD